MYLYRLQQNDPLAKVEVSRRDGGQVHLLFDSSDLYPGMVYGETFYVYGELYQGSLWTLVMYLRRGGYVSRTGIFQVLATNLPDTGKNTPKETPAAFVPRRDELTPDQWEEILDRRAEELEAQKRVPEPEQLQLPDLSASGGILFPNKRAYGDICDTP